MGLGPVNRRAVAVAVLVLAVLLLLATQVWVDAVVEPAPGAPRTRVEATGGYAAPLAPASALLGLAAGVLASVRRTVWVRLLLVVSCVVALGAAGEVVARPAAAVGAGAGAVVSAGVTAWAWGAVTAAVLATLAAVASLVPRRNPARPPVVAAPSPAEGERRSVSELWRALSEGRDPTGGA